MRTTSATGSKRPTAGFTILELLLVLFLIGMIGTLFVVNIDNALRNQEESTVEDAFWEASREGRLQAVLTRHPVVLRFDEEASAFQLTGEEGRIGTFEAVTTTSEGEEIGVAFVQQRPSSELILIRGKLIDTQPIEQVVFYPDGSSTSFSVEFYIGSFTRQIRIDPWTGAEMLPQVES